MTEEGILDDTFVGDDLEPSVWVRRMIKGFSKFVGFSMIFVRGSVLLSFNNLRMCGKDKLLQVVFVILFLQLKKV